MIISRRYNNFVFYFHHLVRDESKGIDYPRDNEPRVIRELYICAYPCCELIKVFNLGALWVDYFSENYFVQQREQNRQ